MWPDPQCLLAAAEESPPQQGGQGCKQLNRAAPPRLCRRSCLTPSAVLQPPLAGQSTEGECLQFGFVVLQPGMEKSLEAAVWPLPLAAGARLSPAALALQVESVPHNSLVSHLC